MLEFATNLYIKFVYYILWMLLLAVIVLIIANRRELARPFSTVKRRTWLLLALIVLIGAVLRISVFPHFHIMFIDEQWYMEMAKNMNYGKGPVVCDYSPEESCYAPFKPPVWPFFISFAQAATLGNYLPLYLSSFFGILSIMLIFLLATYIFGENEGLISALLLSLSDVHLLWSNTAETNVFSLFLALAATIVYFIYLDKRCMRMLMLFSAASALLVLSRFEMIFFIIPLLLLAFRQSMFAVTYFVLLIIFQPLAYTIFRSELTYESYLLNLQFMDISLSLIILALFSIISEKNRIEQAWILFLASLIIYVPLLKETETRMVLLPLIFILMLAAHAMLMLKKFIGWLAYIVIVLVVLQASVGTMELYGKIPRWYAPQIEETQAMREISLAPGSYVVAVFPTVYSSISDTKGVRIDNAASISGEVYFFYDSFCTEKKVARAPGTEKLCDKYLNERNPELLQKLSPHYSLYKSAPEIPDS